VGINKLDDSFLINIRPKLLLSSFAFCEQALTTI